MQMQCLKYNATIPVATCIARQTASLHKRHGYENDPGCIDCAQGKEIMNGSQEAEVETKVCKNPDCPKGSDPKPIDDFYKAPIFSDGLDSYCKKCRLAKQKASRKTKLESKTPPQASATGGKITPAASGEKGKVDVSALTFSLLPEVSDPTPDENILILRFPDNRMELLNKIRLFADAEFRTPEQQIMYWINTHLIKNPPMPNHAGG